MKKFQIRILIALLIISAAVFVGAKPADDHAVLLYGVTPATLGYGVRGTQPSQTISVTSGGTYYVVANAPWIKVNGQSSFAYGGNATFNVTIDTSQLPSHGTPIACGGYYVTGTISTTGMNDVTVTYAICYCC